MSDNNNKSDINQTVDSIKRELTKGDQSGSPVVGIGLQAIKANGGMVMAQNPETAEYNQMPQNSIDIGCTDYILPPQKMPEALIKYAQHAYVKGNWNKVNLSETELEHELKSTREDLQNTIEEMESANEELQSLNEELSTVNNQLQDKVEQLDHAHNDMINLINSTSIATLFIDTEFCIQQFTPATGKLLKLIGNDIGRSIATFATDFTGTDLLDDARQVLDKLVQIENEIRTADGRYYLRRSLPYRTPDNHIEGVAITFVDITERVKSEAQERCLAAVLRDSNDAITVHDLDGNILTWNRGGEQIYGYTENEALKMNICDLIAEDSKKANQKYCRQMLKGKIVESFDTHRLNKDGRKLDIWMTLTPMKDESGHITAIATTERDITELKQIDKLRTESGRLLRMVENLPAGAVYIASKKLMMNRATEAITGYKRHELKTIDQWFTKLHGEDKAEMRKIYETAREANFPKTSAPLTINHKDGESRLVEFSAYRFDDHEVWLLNDVTEREGFEKELMTSEQRLRSIMDNVAESIIVIDEKGIITDFNSASETLFGFHIDETIGHNVSMLMPSPYSIKHDTYLANYLKTGITGIINNPRELTGLRKNGSTFPLELTVTIIEHLGLFCGIIRDLSKQKEMEKEVADICSIEQDRIGKDIHDGLGQQLTGLSLMTASLQRELIREKQPFNKKLDEIINYLQQATTDARLLSRGLAPMSIETLGLADAIEILASSIQNTTGINCQFEANKKTKIKSATNSIQVYRIAQEAVNNAVKHANAQNIHIQLINTDHFELTIKDDGSGFDVSSKKLDNSLGLRIMRYRAGILGCNMTFESTPDAGTVIHCERLHEVL